MSVPIDPFKINEAVLDLWRCYIVERDMVKELEAENARLKAEVERLNTGIQPEGSNDAVGRAVNVLLEKEKEIARLKAEVERLTKAGDAMHLDVKTRAVNGISIQERNSMRGWEYAKQGGQP